MQFIVKLAITNLIIIFCVQVGRKYPSLAGLIDVESMVRVLDKRNPHAALGGV